jgi:hypothetical protein
MRKIITVLKRKNLQDHCLNVLNCKIKKKFSQINFFLLENFNV